MKKILLFVLAVSVALAQPTPVQVREATAAEVTAGTAGFGVYISPRRLSGAGSGLPSQTGNSGKFLTTDGATASWATVSAGVTSITGTANQITASAATGAVTLSLPNLVAIPTSGNGYVPNLHLNGGSSLNYGFSPVSASSFGWANGAAISMSYYSGPGGGMVLSKDSYYTWSSGVDGLPGSEDTKIKRASAGVVEVDSAIKTGAPTAGSAGVWKLGAMITSSGLLVSTTQAVRINIGGTDYSLAVLTSNP